MLTNTSIFIFRRDFRVDDNPAFFRCVKWCETNNARLIPCFIYSKKQISAKINKYFSPFAFSAMNKFLDHLDSDLGGKLVKLYTDNSDIEVLRELKTVLGVTSIFFNSDVTPFAKKRDLELMNWCVSEGIYCDCGEVGDGYLIWPARSILTKSGGTIPKVFFAFYRYSKDKLVETLGIPSLKLVTGITTKLPKSILADNRVSRSMNIHIPPIPELSNFIDYGKTRDDYNYDTTRLSVYLKFGVLSFRKVLLHVRKLIIPELERQLIWREFYYHLAAGYPEIITVPNRHIRPDRDIVQWKRTDEKKLEMWVTGTTGDVLVDNAMKQLRSTGWIHNRLRMVVSTYLIKVMGIDWRDGEREMAKMLMDYDPAQNSGGWQSMDSQIPGQEISSKTQLRKFGPNLQLFPK